MEYSKLLQDLLQHSEQLRIQSLTEQVSAPCFLAAVSEFCAVPYRGLTQYDGEFFPQRYEEERLRYLYKTVFKASANLVGRRYRRGLCSEFSGYTGELMTQYAKPMEAAAAHRGLGGLTADLVFLTALRALEPAHRVGVYPDFKEDFSVTAALEDADRNTYDYILLEISRIMQKLQDKADDAKAQRDWRPAAKFAEPEALLDAFCGAVQTRTTGHWLELLIPGFFGEATGQLRLLIGYFGGCYCVHDHGCALYQLRKNAGSEAKFQSVYRRICPSISLDEDRVVDVFCQMHTFLGYLQDLMLIANADLFYLHLHGENMRFDRDRAFFQETQPFDTQGFLQSLRQCFGCYYDEYKGLLFTVDTTYSLNSSTVAYQIETTQAGSVCISDGLKERMEGAVFECFDRGEDCLIPYTDYISRYCERFGAQFDGKDISLTVTQAQLQDIPKVLLRFMNLAVLLSEFGALIEPPAAT